MKFTDGNWLLNKDIKAHYPHQVYDTEISDDSLAIYCPDKQIRDRADTVDGMLMSVRFTSPMVDVICVKMEHFKGEVTSEPKFEIQDTLNKQMVIKEDDNEIVLNTGGLSVCINKKEPFIIDFMNGEKSITKTGYKKMAYMEKENTGNFMMTQLDIGVGECVYGLGERFTSLVKNGQAIDIWNEDGGTSSQQSYKNIPFYMTNKGYGVFVNHTGCVSFEVASERVTKVQFSVPGESLEYYVIYGPSSKAILEKYTSLTGKPSLPPAWSFGLWLTTSFTTSYDEKTVTGIIDGMIKRDLPLAVFHFDCFWMKEYHLCDFQWDTKVFPDPKGMLKRLKEKGLKICVWINPYIAQRSSMFDEGKANGYFLKKKNGDVWQWDRWQAGMAIVDFTNPEACAWYALKLKKLMDMGVDCFKTDFGERIPTDVVYYNGDDSIKMHNYYTYLYNKVVFESIQEAKGEKEAIVFARSATVGSQKFSVHWGGDSTADYESMAESLRGGLSLSMSGFGFWSHDIGGFENTSTPDIYKRWVAFGMLSPLSRLHGSKSYRVPWAYDAESVDVLRYFTKLKCSLMPYLYGAAIEAASKGIPMMRAMLLEFMEDPNCEYIDRQYMLGEAMLVAPIFSTSGDVSYYLPKGVWTNFLTGEKVVGGTWKFEKHNYLSIPLMARPNSIIAVGNTDVKPDYDYANGVTLQVFEIEDGASLSSIVSNTKGFEELKVSIKRNGQDINIKADNLNKPWSILLRGLSEFEEVKNATCIVESLGIRLIPNKQSSEISITIS